MVEFQLLEAVPKLRHVGTTKISRKFGGFPNTVGKTSEHVFSSLLTILSLIPGLNSCQKFPFLLNKVCRLCLSVHNRRPADLATAQK